MGGQGRRHKLPTVRRGPFQEGRARGAAVHEKLDGVDPGPLTDQVYRTGRIIPVHSVIHDTLPGVVTRDGGLDQDGPALDILTPTLHREIHRGVKIGGQFLEHPGIGVDRVPPLDLTRDQGHQVHLVPLGGLDDRISHILHPGGRVVVGGGVDFPAGLGHGDQPREGDPGLDRGGQVVDQGAVTQPLLGVRDDLVGLGVKGRVLFTELAEPFQEVMNLVHGLVIPEMIGDVGEELVHETGELGIETEHLFMGGIFHELLQDVLVLTKDNLVCF